MALPSFAEDAPAADPAALTEIVWASSESHATLVARRMEAGFLVSQLLMPGTKHLGRAPLADLQASVRSALEKAAPGKPVTLPGPDGGVLVAQILPPPSGIIGDTEYIQDPSKVGAKPAHNPTNTDLLTWDVGADGSDLAAVCKAKTEMVANEIELARSMVAALPAEPPLVPALRTYGRLAGALAFTTDLAGAIRAFEAIDERVRRQPPTPGRSRHMTYAAEGLGILHLRRAELDNCVMHHNAQMCLFPLSAEARHRHGDGGQRALEYFTRALEQDPENLEVRWLLNVAAMTIGKYPEGVPEKHRIGPESFQSKENIGRFADVAAAVGIARTDNAGGSIADDFDGDGLFDIVVSSRDPCEPLRLYRNRGDGTFDDRTKAAGLESQLGGLNVVQTDYDNDGRVDLFVLRGGWETAIRNSLLRNNGDGTFTDVTSKAGLGGPAHRTHSAAWADFDNDGWLDVFVGHEMSYSQLFRNRGDGTFEDVTEKAGLRFRALVKGVAAGDVDGDGWTDLYVSNFGGANLLFRNLGRARFEEVAARAGVADPYFSFPTWMWDYDNDGRLDIYVASNVPTVEEQAREYLGLPPAAETMKLYRNRGDGRFEDVTEAVGLARAIPTMGANFGDLDNDGFLDFHLSTGAPSYAVIIPNRTFRNRAGKSFVDVTESTGTGHLQKGHGVSFADFDGDGDDDMHVDLGGAYLGDKYPNALFENPGHGNDWISVRLAGTKTNRPGVGARIRVVLEEGGAETQRVRFVGSDSSFGSSPLVQHIGLGKKARLKRLEIHWPVSGTTQTVDGVAVNQAIEVTEGKAGFRRLETKRFQLGGGKDATAAR
jgi:hypothetical protein